MPNQPTLEPSNTRMYPSRIAKVCVHVAVALLTQSSHAQSFAGIDIALSRADTNHDGTLTLDEFLATQKRRFARIDRNGDGFFEANDLPFDKDKDGRVGQDEFLTGLQTLFDLVDANKNKQLEPDEIKKASTAIRAVAP